MKSNFKKVFAVLLSVALIAAMFVMPSTATAQNYRDYSNNTVVNGNFEAGIVGAEPYGWDLRSVAAGSAFVANPEEYTDSFSFTTVLDGTNKVAQLEKTGVGGYISIESYPIAVKSGAEYLVSFDYKILDFEVGQIDNCPYGCGTECDFAHHFFGAKIKFVQYDAAGSILDADGAVTTDATYSQNVTTDDAKKEIMSDFETIDGVIKVSANAASIRVYITFVTVPRTSFVTQFDNINLLYATEITDDLINGDFEVTTTDKVGGKPQGTEGPAGWSIYGATNSGCTAISHGSSYPNNIMMTTKTEDLGEGKTNKYMEWKFIDGKTVAGTAKGYSVITSNKMAVPKGGTSKLRIDFKFKSYAQNEGTFQASTAFTLSVKFYFFSADGEYVAQAGEKIYSSTASSTTPQTEWTEFKTNSNPMALVAMPTNENIEYFTIAITCAADFKEAVNCAFAFDNFRIRCYELKDEVADSDFEEMSVETSGAPSTSNYNANYVLQFANDRVRGEVIKTQGSSLDGRYGCTGQVAYMHKTDRINFSTDNTVKVSFDYKIEGFAEALRYHTMLGGTKTVDIFNTYYGPAIVLHYYDANDTYLGCGVVYANHRTEDVDWTHKDGTLTAPAGAAYAKWGLFAKVGGNVQGGSLINSYYDNIVVKNGTDSFWEEENDLFNKVLLADCDANGDTAEDLKDLVAIKNMIAGESDLTAAGDMNKNGKADEGDLTYLRWKLLGLDETEVVW